MYQKFAQAHVDGLKNLLSHFEAFTLRCPMPRKKSPTRCSGPTKN